MWRIIKFIFFGALTFGLFYICEFGTPTIVVGGLSIKGLPALGKFWHPQQGYLQNAVNADEIKEQISLPGVKDEVTIVYDDRLVPHIYARNDYDLFYTQGFVTAQHRLWQMDFQVRVAAGRLSEVVGQATLFMDFKNRNKGLSWAAEKSVAFFEKDPETKMVLDAYTAGINDYIAQLDKKNYPIEFKLLNYEPEPWSNFKSALLLKYMADMLTGESSDLELSNALAVFGEENMELFYPDYNAKDSLLTAPIVPVGTAFPTPTFAVDTVDNIGIYNKRIHEPSEQIEEAKGSNNWAVNGNKTATGKPMLCNDPHLMLNLPSIWFEIQLNSPNYNTYGVSIPGAPAIIIGFNDSVSWGVTNGTQDVIDLYKMKFKDNRKEEYLFDGEWKKTTPRVEEIKIKYGETIYDTIMYTHFGPVLKHNFDTIANNLAMRWTAYEPANELKTFILMNKAKNYSDYNEAIKHYECPGQNFIFASHSGDIAIWQQGKFPARFNKQGKYIMDGTQSIYQWKGFIPQQENPHSVNPERNFVSSANQFPTDGTYPYYYTGRFEYFRNRRINDVLSKSDSIDFNYMMKLQNDNFNLQASESLPFMLLGLDETKITAENKPYFEIIKNWNFFNEKEAAGAAIYESWWKEFNHLIFDEFTLDNKEFEYPQAYPVIQIMKKFPNHPIFDNKYSDEIENVKDLLLSSFNTACVNIRNNEIKYEEKVTWANFKRTSVQHLARINSFGVFNIPIGGNRGIVNACSDRWGPSWRMIVSLEKEIKAMGVYPGGQSGNPASKFYKNGIDKWSNGEYYSLNFWKSKDEALSKKMVSQTITKK